MRRYASLLFALLLNACDEAAPAPPTDATPNDLAPDITAPPDVAIIDDAPGADTAAPVDARPPLANPFSTGPYGANVRDIAAPFTVPTQDGDWSFQDQWTGDDSYVFLVYAPGTIRYPNGVDYSASLFDGSLADLLDHSPRNVHYFFLYTTMEEGFNTARDSWLGELGSMPEADRAHWQPRLHFVSSRVSALDNWISRMIGYRGRTALPNKRYDAHQFAIDRRQRIREVGMLGRLATGGIQTDLNLLAHEPEYYNYEWDRDARIAMERERVRVIELARTVTAHDTIEVDVELPSAETMAGYDTMEVDLSMECPNHRDGECGAWDYLSHLRLCEPAPAAPDAGAPDGGGPRWQCNREIARWITSYWREAHWVTDISGMLALLQEGGRRHFQWHASGQFDPRRTDYIVTLSLRLSNRARAMRPFAAVPLWQGGNWNAMYDASHPAMTVNVPSDARRVDLYALITGHGGVQPTNCAEFCSHEHHFNVNGMEHLRAFPEARSPDGCANRVTEGVVPNQHGTWYFGRGGWCPGLDVAPWVTDITREVRVGMPNELRYSTTYGGRPVTAGLGNIVLTSYLVFWR